MQESERGWAKHGLQAPSFLPSQILSLSFFHSLSFCLLSCLIARSHRPEKVVDAVDFSACPFVGLLPEGLFARWLQLAIGQYTRSMVVLPGFLCRLRFSEVSSLRGASTQTSFLRMLSSF